MLTIKELVSAEVMTLPFPHTTFPYTFPHKCMMPLYWSQLDSSLHESILQVRLTCSHLCEPGGAGVEVDSLKADHLAWLCALADGHTDKRILLLWDHQHLKHLQWARKRKVKVLPKEKKESTRWLVSVVF